MNYVIALLLAIHGVIVEVTSRDWRRAEACYLRAMGRSRKLPSFFHRRLAVISEAVAKLGLHGGDGRSEWTQVALNFGSLASADTAAPGWILRMGNAYASAENWPAAIESYLMALRLKQDHSEAMFRLGGAQARLGLHPEALRSMVDMFAGDRAGERVDWFLALAHQCELTPGNHSRWIRARLNGGVDVPSSSLDLIVDRQLEPTAAVEVIQDWLADAKSAPDAFPEAWWMVAFCRLMLAGCVRAAYAAKTQAAERCLDLCSTSRDTLCIPSAVAAATWLGRANSALRLPKKTAGSSGLGERIADIRFGRLVKGKRIAIVCPANSALVHGSEIDGYDLVVRPNYRNETSSRERRCRSGSRTDISYYNREHFQARAVEILQSLSDSPVQYIVARDRSTVRLCPTRGRLRSSFEFVYHARGFALAHILNDLLPFGPAEIKVFHADFFLGSPPHYRNYFTSDVNVREAYLLHDPVFTRRFVKALRDSGSVVVDEDLERILTWDEERFIQEIEARCQ